MGVHFTRASAQCASIAQAPGYNGAYSMMGWFRMSSPADGMQPLWVGAGAGVEEFFFYGDAGDQKFYMRLADGVGSQQGAWASTSAADTWYFVADVRASATDARMYLGTTAANITERVGVFNRDESARGAATTVSVGGILPSMEAGLTFNGDAAGVRIWNGTSLTLAQLKTEAASPTPVLASPWAAWRLPNASDLTDSSGNGRHLAATNGPLTDSTDPDAWGSAALTGTAVGGITEADVVAGGKTIILTLTGSTWLPS